MTRRISYAQNAEDIVLARAFAEQATGFYIDVGAADPRADSVTKLFYDQGWRGINVEPQRKHWQDLERERPRDVNLMCGLGAEPGRRRFALNLDIPGWSTFSEEFIARYQAADMQLEAYELEIRTLADVCSEHVADAIDFVKIDVEGFEREVLLGADWKRYRPRVILIEATNPETWDYLLTEEGYREVLFDGLNRFYVRKEDEALIRGLSAPANVMDDYVSWIMADHIAALEQRIQELDAEVTRVRATRSMTGFELGVRARVIRPLEAALRRLHR